MRKRILITSTAGVGHFYPLIPVAQMLNAQGCDVLVATPDSFVNEVVGAKLEPAPFADSDKTDSRLIDFFAVAPTLKPGEWNAKVAELIFGLTNVEYAMPELKLTISQHRPQIIISEQNELAGPLLAYKHNIPLVRFGVSQAVTDQTFLPEMLKGLNGALMHEGIVPGRFRDYLLNSPYLTYFPKSFESNGYVQPPGSTTRILHPYLEHNLEIIKPKTPLVYVTLGTVAGTLGHYPTLMQRIIGGLKGKPIEAVAAIGRSSDATLLKAVPQNVTIRQWVDQQDILKQASLVICHGGSGTILGALAFGLPIIAVPLFADQLDNARQVIDSGVGASVDKARDVEAEISNQVDSLLQTPPKNSHNIQLEMRTHTPLSQVVGQLLET